MPTWVGPDSLQRPARQQVVDREPPRAGGSGSSVIFGDASGAAATSGGIAAGTLGIALPAAAAGIAAAAVGFLTLDASAMPCVRRRGGVPAATLVLAASGTAASRPAWLTAFPPRAAAARVAWQRLVSTARRSLLLQRQQPLQDGVSGAHVSLRGNVQHRVSTAIPYTDGPRGSTTAIKVSRHLPLGTKPQNVAVE